MRLLDGTHVNYTLVKDGWCWWYRKYAPGDFYYPALFKTIMQDVVKELQSIFPNTK